MKIQIPSILQQYFIKPLHTCDKHYFLFLSLERSAFTTEK